MSEVVSSEWERAWLNHAITACPDCDSEDQEQRDRAGPFVTGMDEWEYRQCEHPWHEGEPERDPQLALKMKRLREAP